VSETLWARTRGKAFPLQKFCIIFQTNSSSFAGLGAYALDRILLSLVRLIILEIGRDAYSLTKKIVHGFGTLI
jgi:hypothetical protein